MRVTNGNRAARLVGGAHLHQIQRFCRGLLFSLFLGAATTLTQAPTSMYDLYSEYLIVVWTRTP
jgi:hypothetical protein